MTIEDRRLRVHCTRCRVCRVGGQCREGLLLLRDADAGDYRRALSPERQMAGSGR